MADVRQSRADKVPELCVLTSVHGAREGNALILDQKALEGLKLYASAWPGRVRWMLNFRDSPPSYSTRCDPATLPFEVVAIAQDRSDVIDKLPPDALVLSGADNMYDLELAARLPGRVVHIIEYTLRTRLDIIRFDDLSWPRKIRRALWTVMMERKRKRAIRAAAGLQCNGLPSFHRYQPIARQAMYYFDNRLSADLQVTVGELAAKQAAMREGRALCLVFSGRIDRMKGAQFLLPLMQRLRAAGVRFQFHIFGAGAHEGALKAAANDTFSGCLNVHGAVPFAEALLPFLKAQADLFVCPHPQGDPSCTYIETLGCGVPIVGFANEAWAAMSSGQHFGETVPVADVAALADAIARLDGQRDELARMAEAAADYARQHAFEKEFSRRIDHLASVVNYAPDGRAPDVAGPDVRMPDRSDV